MPCDTVQVTRTNLLKIEADQVVRSLMEAGLPIQARGQWVTVPQECGTGSFRVIGWGTKGTIIECRGNVDSARLETFVKTVHTRRVIMSQAQRFGWRVQATGTNTFKVSR